MRKLIVLPILFAFILTACGASGEPGSLEARQIAELETRIAALEGQIADLSAAGGEHSADEAVSPAFAVAVAQYVMDTAGFHAMDEALNENQTIDPAYLSVVKRVRKVVAQAPWPETLHEQSGAFVDLLDELAAALDADNGPEAAALAAEAHAAQHDFTHSIDSWLGGESGDHGHGE